MTDLKLSYFNIQRFCLQDGPGIRTAIFLKGCPLRCVWCHNPEGQSFDAELMFRPDRCTGCGRCLGLCDARYTDGGKVTVDRELFTACGKCVEPCLSDCSEICGKTGEADALYEILKRDEPFFEESGGGITVSGGEPLSQPDGVLRLAERAKRDGVGFAVETSGYCDENVLCELKELGTLFLYDIKGVDRELHIKNTGVSNEKIFRNLEMLTDLCADVILRLPLVPGFNDSEEALSSLAAFLGRFSGKVRRAEIMPYHRIGLGKYAALGRGNESLKGIPDGKNMCERWLAALGGAGVEIISN